MCLCVINDPQDLPMLVSIFLVCAVYLMRGEYDDRLKWPFRGDITVQLVNQSSDQNHEEVTFEFDGMSSISSCNRVTSDEERAKSGSDKKILTILDSVCPHVKEDCVRFRVTKVSVTSA